jgi:hypothetical protein
MFNEKVSKVFMHGSVVIRMSFCILPWEEVCINHELIMFMLQPGRKGSFACGSSAERDGNGTERYLQPGTNLSPHSGSVEGHKRSFCCKLWTCISLI